MTSSMKTNLLYFDESTWEKFIWTRLDVYEKYLSIIEKLTGNTMSMINIHWVLIIYIIVALYIIMNLFEHHFFHVSITNISKYISSVFVSRVCFLSTSIHESMNRIYQSLSSFSCWSLDTYLIMFSWWNKVQNYDTIRYENIRKSLYIVSQS